MTISGYVVRDLSPSYILNWLKQAKNCFSVSFQSCFQILK